MALQYDEESDSFIIDFDDYDKESQDTLDYIFEQHRKAQQAKQDEAKQSIMETYGKQRGNSR
jgi:hypothetical protein